MFAVSRFAHYLKCMVRDKIGGFASKESLETWLNAWIGRFVDTGKDSPDEIKARFPLAQAQVVVEEDQENPGYYSSKFYLRPHYQLEGLTVSLRLVSKLPKDKK
jgi:type VI secretion system protein ImpC